MEAIDGKGSRISFNYQFILLKFQTSLKNMSQFGKYALCATEHEED